MKTRWALAILGLQLAFVYEGNGALFVTPSPAAEGSSIRIQFIESDTPCFPNSRETFNVAFGDGTSTNRSGTCGADDSFIINRLYADNSGTNPFSITVTEFTGNTSHVSYATLIVTNIAPTLAPFSNSIAQVDQPFSLNFSITDPGADTWTVSANWGDGSESVFFNGTNKSTILTHTYTNTGAFTITTEVQDDDGGFTTRPQTVYVNPPTNAPLSLSLFLFAGLVIDGRVGDTYDIERATILDTNQWTNVAAVTLTNFHQLWIDTQSTNSSRNFYRATRRP